MLGGRHILSHSAVFVLGLALGGIRRPPDGLLTAATAMDGHHHDDSPWSSTLSSSPQTAPTSPTPAAATKCPPCPCREAATMAGANDTTTTKTRIRRPSGKNHGHHQDMHQSAASSDQKGCAESPSSSSQKQSSQEQQQQYHPEFPPGFSNVIHSAAYVRRDDFLNTIDLGTPPDPTGRGNELAAILYTSPKSRPTVGRTTTASSSNDPNQQKQQPPEILSANDALHNCGTLHLVQVDTWPEDDPHHTCFALVGQWGVRHIHKFVRIPGEPNDQTLYVPPRKELEDDAHYHPRRTNHTLRHVSWFHGKAGSRMRFLPQLDDHAQRVIVPYWRKLPTTLQRLKPLLQQAAAASQALGHGPMTVILMVSNQGQGDLLRNFVCSARARQLATSNIVVLATDAATTQLARDELQLLVFDAQDAFGLQLPTQESKDFADETFHVMTLAKVFAAHCVNRLGYHFLLQDVDVVWFRHPLDFFRQHGILPQDDAAVDEQRTRLQQFDLVFQDDGSRNGLQHGFSANTGFYFCRHTMRTRYYFYNLIQNSDLIATVRVDQPAMNLLLNEQASLRGLRVKVLAHQSEVGQYLPSGKVYHQNPDYMKRIMLGKFTPTIFHMNWTRNKKEKIQNLEQMGLWFVSSSDVDDKGVCQKRESQPPQDQSPQPESSSSSSTSNCCLAQPVPKCHFRNLPSPIRLTCQDSPPSFGNAPSFW